MSANLLNKTDFPSITGFDARDPRLPKPKIAPPLLITATKISFASIIVCKGQGFLQFL